MDSYFSDSSLEFLATPSKRRPTTAISTTTAKVGGAGPAVSTSIPQPEEEATPTDLLLATPPAILRLLTLSAPTIHGLDVLVQVVTWQHPSFFTSLLAVLGWWAICLFGATITRYFLPPLLLGYITIQYIAYASSRTPPPPPRHRSRTSTIPPTLTPASYTNLLYSAQSLSTSIHSLRTDVLYPLLSHFSFVVPSSAASSSSLKAKPPHSPAYYTSRFLITSFPCYLLVTYFVPLNFIFLVLGSVALLWNAPFFRNSRTILWRSAFVRWVVRIMLALLRGGSGLAKELQRAKKGVGIIGLLGKKESREDRVQGKAVKVGKGGDNNVGETENGDEDADEGEDVRLQFTVFENQRWWVGLDWTHALLPGERASW